MSGLCEEHNKLSLRHMADLEDCEGFCHYGAACDELKDIVRECKQCQAHWNPSFTHRYLWHKDGYTDQATGQRAPFAEVEAYCLDGREKPADVAQWALSKRNQDP